jgi:hypothetical protein
MYFPLGEKATGQLIVSSVFRCPLNRRISLPPSTSHKRASSLPVSTYFPSGEKATDITKLDTSNRCTSLPLIVSHKRAVLSSLPVSTYFPSGEKATELTGCPENRRTILPLITSHKHG